MNDPNDINLWKVKHDNEIIGEVLKLIPGIETQKVLHTALNGAVYVQQIGPGIKQLRLTIFVDSQDQLMKVEEANAGGGFISIQYRNKIYYGFITDDKIEWEEAKPGCCYTADVTVNYTLAVEV